MPEFTIAGAKGVDAARLLEAVGRLCLADGVKATQLDSILFRDDEVTVRVLGTDGRARNNTYPLATLINATAPAIACSGTADD